MPSPRVYDKAKYHSGGNWPAGLAEEQSFVHTGLFLGWLVERCLVSDEFAERHTADLAAFSKREITGPGLYEVCGDGCLIDDMLSAVGNEFASSYFDLRSGRYLADYEETLCADLPSLYHVPDTWASYDKLKVVLDRRFDEWWEERRAKRR